MILVAPTWQCGFHFPKNFRNANGHFLHFHAIPACQRGCFFCPEGHVGSSMVPASTWPIPAKSPDLNPAEKFWSWLRRRLRAMDLADLSARRAPVPKCTLKTRVRNLLQTQPAKRVVGKCASGLRRVCREVVRLHGAATRG